MLKTPYLSVWDSETRCCLTSLSWQLSVCQSKSAVWQSASNFCSVTGPGFVWKFHHWHFFIILSSWHVTFVTLRLCDICHIHIFWPLFWKLASHGLTVSKGLPASSPKTGFFPPKNFHFLGRFHFLGPIFDPKGKFLFLGVDQPLPYNGSKNQQFSPLISKISHFIPFSSNPFLSSQDLL